MLGANTLGPVSVDFSPEGIFVLESRHRKGFRMEDVEHDFLKILYAFKGKGYLIHGNRRHFVKNDVAIIPPRTRHRLEDSQDAPLFVYGLCIRQSFMECYPSIISISGNIQLFRHPVWVEELRNMLRNLLIEQSRTAPGGGACMVGLTWQMIALIIRAGSLRNANMSSIKGSELAVERVRAYAASLSQCFYLDLSLDEVSERLGLSRRRFTQIFRQIMGESWLSAIRRLRMAHACRLLKETDRSISSIAFESGYADLSNFYRTFREYTGGSSPYAWRVKQLQKGLE